MNCPLCHSASVSAGADHPSPFGERRYTLFTCSACRSAFFDVAEHEVVLEQLYEDHAETSVDDYSADRPRSYYWRKQVEALRRLHPGPIASVLDVGCRTGDFLMHWPPDLERVGVELSRRAADVAERRGLRVHRGFVEQTSFAQRFDVVSCYAIVEHLPEPLPFLRHLPELMNPGGVLVVLIPTRQCLKHRLTRLLGVPWHMDSPPQHLNFPSRRCLDDILGGCGLRLVRRRYTSGGMFNPFRRVPRLAALFAPLMSRLDHASPLNRLPVFDHMYSFYSKDA